MDNSGFLPTEFQPPAGVTSLIQSIPLHLATQSSRRKSPIFLIHSSVFTLSPALMNSAPRPCSELFIHEFPLTSKCEKEAVHTFMILSSFKMCKINVNIFKFRVSCWPSLQLPKVKDRTSEVTRKVGTQDFLTMNH